MVGLVEFFFADAIHRRAVVAVYGSVKDIVIVVESPRKKSIALT